MKKTLFIFAALLAVSCVEEGKIEPAVTKVPVTVGIAETKTMIADKQISFTGSEAMTLVCEGLNFLAVLVCACAKENVLAHSALKTRKGIRHNYFVGITEMRLARGVSYCGSKIKFFHKSHPSLCL